MSVSRWIGAFQPRNNRSDGRRMGAAAVLADGGVAAVCVRAGGRQAVMLLAGSQRHSCMSVFVYRVELCRVQLFHTATALSRTSNSV